MQTSICFIESILSVSLSSYISMDNSKLTSNRNSQTLPSFLLCCMISSVEYKDSTFTLTLFYFLSFSHSIHSKIKWKTDSHIHIVFSPNNFTLFFILSKYFSFHSFPITIHSIAKTQWKLFSIFFSFTRFNAWFSSAALLAGMDSASPSHWWVLWVFWVVFSTFHPKFNHEYSASLRSCGQIEFV